MSEGVNPDDPDPRINADCTQEECGDVNATVTLEFGSFDDQVVVTTCGGLDTAGPAICVEPGVDLSEIRHNSDPVLDQHGHDQLIALTRESDGGCLDRSGVDPSMDPPVDVTIDPSVHPQMELSVDHSVDPPVDPLMDHSIDRRVDLPMDLPMDHSINHPVQLSMDLPIDPPTDLPFDPPMDQPIGPPMDPAMDSLMDYPVDTPMDPSIDQQVDLPVDLQVDPLRDPPVDTLVNDPHNADGFMELDHFGVVDPVIHEVAVEGVEPIPYDYVYENSHVEEATAMYNHVASELDHEAEKWATYSFARRQISLCFTPPGVSGEHSVTGVSVGDVLLRVGEVETDRLTHNQAQNHLQASGNLLQLHVAKPQTEAAMPVGRGGSGSPSVTNPQPDQYATRLSQQLADMDMNSPMSPSHYGSTPSYPTTNGQPDYGGYNNYSDTFNGDSMYQAPQAPPLQAPQAVPSYRPAPTPPLPGGAMPDKVLNMAAKGGPGKTPFSYVPDADMLKEHRDRVRRRQGANLPHYQNLLNMPSFDDNLPPPVAPHSSNQAYRPASAQGSHGGSSPGTPDIFKAGPGSATVTHAQYNSPMGLYSNDNVVTAFAGQTDGLVTGVRTQGGAGKPSGPDITQSAVYKLIHGLDEPPPDPRPQSRRPAPEDVTTSESGQMTTTDSGRVTSESGSLSTGSESLPSTPGSRSPTSRHVAHRWRGHRQVVRQPSQDDEVSFSGVGRDAAYEHIPSRAFHKLQSLTGGGEVDRSSIRGSVTGEDDEVGNYNESSIRYRGGSIPSRSFRMLQSMTGSDNRSTPPGVPAGPRHRSLRRAESAPHRQEEEEYEDRGGGVDLSYVGAHIPSRSFRMLQRSVGADPNDYDSGVQNGMEDPLMVGPSDGMQPTTEEQTRAARERRRRRRRGSASLPRQVSSSPVRRPVLPTTQPHEAQPSNFDEDAYLAGRVPIVRSEEEIQARPVVGRTRSVQAEPDDEIPSENLRAFDEQAFLAGQMNIMGDPDNQSNLPPRAPKKKEFSVRPEWANTVARKKKTRAFERSTSQVAQDRQREQEKASMQYINIEDTPKRDFDEKAFLSGQIGIFDDKPKAPRPGVKENKAPNKEPYEFQRIAQRRASIDFLDPLKRAQEGADFPAPLEPEMNAYDKEPFDERAFLQGMVPVVSEKNIPKQIPSWVKKAPQADPDCFDEKDYLHGRIPLIGEGTPDLRPVIRPKKKKPKQPEPEPEPINQVPFDEKAFLAGQIPILGGSLDETAPPREPRKKVEKQYAEWERRHDDNDEQPDDNSHEFDERQFLQGKLPVVRGSVESPRIVPFSPKQQPKKQRAPWERFRVETDREEGESEFEENRYLAGQVSTGVRDSIERDLGTTTKNTTDNDASNQRIPSKTFIRLTRSVSRDACEDPSESAPPTPTKPDLKVLRRARGNKPSFDRSRSMSPGTAQRRQMELQMGTSKDVPMDDMKYTGTGIPGKAFARLQSQISRSEADETPKDPLERLRRNSLTARQKPAWEEGCVDAEKALEVMEIKEHSPERFFDALEDVVKGKEPKVNGTSEPPAVVKPAVPQSQQTNAPRSGPTGSYKFKAPAPSPSQKTNMPKSAPPPSQQTNTPKPVPPSQQTNTPRPAPPSQQTNATKPAAPAPQQQLHMPQQQISKPPGSPSTGGIKIISRSISQEPKQQQQQQQQQPQEIQPAPQKQLAPKQQVHIQPQQPQQQKQQPAQQKQEEQQPQQQQFADLPNFQDGEDQVTDF